MRRVTVILFPLSLSSVGRYLRPSNKSRSPFFFFSFLFFPSHSLPKTHGGRRLTSLEKISIRLDSHDKFSPSFFGAMEKITCRKEEEKEMEEGAKRKAQTIVIYYNGRASIALVISSFLSSSSSSSASASSPFLRRCWGCCVQRCPTDL